MLRRTICKTTVLFNFIEDDNGEEEDAMDCEGVRRMAFPTL